MRQGKILLEGKPDELRARLNGRIIEVHGQPLQLLRDLARQDANVEDAQMFGDRLHLRVHPGLASQVIQNLQAQSPSRGGKITQMSAITPQLEDVFIDLLEDQSDRVNT
jgi:ABC-2 type transport system ATP-binding protein